MVIFAREQFITVPRASGGDSPASRRIGGGGGSGSGTGTGGDVSDRERERQLGGREGGDNEIALIL